MFRRYFGHIGTFASLIGLIFTLKPQNKDLTPLIIVLICISTLFLVFAIYQEIILYLNRGGKIYKSSKGIRNYMFKWISQEGISFIFTRDLSWVNDDDMKDLLRKKARTKELKICLAEVIPLVKELNELGAEVYTYNQLEYTLKSRFTFVKVGRVDSKVAIGRDLNGKHFIEEFRATDEPVFSIASDLLEVLTRHNRLLDKEKSSYEGTKVGK